MTERKIKARFDPFLNKQILYITNGEKDIQCKTIDDCEQEIARQQMLEVKLLDEKNKW